MLTVKQAAEKWGITVRRVQDYCKNGTAYTFESIMGTDADGNRYAGGVLLWSVFSRKRDKNNCPF